MIIKVDAKERDILEYQCAVFGLDCHIFTIENNPKLVQAEILHEDGGDLDAETSWLLCVSVQAKAVRV